MSQQRALQQATRRLVSSRATTGLPSSLPFASPAAVLLFRQQFTTGRKTTNSLSQTDGLKILERQRLHRPVSPHLGIYRPQLTWVLSSLNRITGAVLSGGLYIFGAWYLAGPYLGLGFTAAGMAAGFAKWPLVLKIAAKFSLAWPFTFHCVNGLRHLLWDTGSTITNKQVIQTGWLAVGISAVTALLLTYI